MRKAIRRPRPLCSRSLHCTVATPHSHKESPRCVHSTSSLDSRRRSKFPQPGLPLPSRGPIESVGPGGKPGRQVAAVVIEGVVTMSNYGWFLGLVCVLALGSVVLADDKPPSEDARLEDYF